MNITYNKVTHEYILGNTPYTKEAFLAYIDGDMLEAALATRAGDFEIDTSDTEEIQRTENMGVNVLFYGVPGAGKSHTIESEIDKNHSERVVFHPDYTYSDFIGQILPRCIDGAIRYVFEPGPFTKMLKKAYDDPEHMYYLVIEEINRGNAPAIFGDVFQLLDRCEDGSGKYSISNYDMATAIYGDENHSISMPANLSILATMNTSDQNVFTLDTAFQRRWEMRLIQNKIESACHANELIESSSITWGTFAKVTNETILRMAEEIGSSADKRLGAYFATAKELSCKKFPEKVLKYLWDDAFKLDRDAYFNTEISSLDSIIEIFDKDIVGNDPLKEVLKDEIYEKMLEQSR